MSAAETTEEQVHHLDDETAADVLVFWLGDLTAPHDFDDTRAPRWFTKDPAFDDEVRRRFGALIEAAQQGTLVDDDPTPRRALARVILLDQLSRNVYRDQARMYAGDERALALVKEMLARGDEEQLGVVERMFLYMPLMHSEALADQDESVRRFHALHDTLPPAVRDAPLGKVISEAARYADLHRDIIVRFGRYPHRNAILGRESTPEEREFLTQPNSSF